MRFRNSRLRTKITALLVSLAALWAFAAWVTLRDGLNLLGVNTIDQKVSRPGVTLVTALQQERRLSMVYLGRPRASERQALDAQRPRTDAAVGRFRSLAAGGDVSRFASAELKARIKESFTRLDDLRTGRQAIDTRLVKRDRATAAFDDIIDATFRIYRAAGGLSDQRVAADSRTLVSMTWAKEVLAREDALLAGSLAAGHFTGTEHAQFAELVGAQRLLHEQAAAELPAADRARYDRLTKGAEFVRFRQMEDRLVEKGRTGARPPVSAAQWQTTVQPIMTQLEKLTLDAGDELVDRAAPVAIGVIVRLVLAGGLGLIAVIASVVVSITTTRALLRQLEKLRNAALELADRRLPSVVERLGHGENVDVAAEAPPLAFGNDEIGQVGHAFNSVQETAIRTAVEQAELRRGFRDILLSLARRSQTLVHRQLTLLDDIERRNDDPKDLEEIFRVDHLATRMRRNAENLIVLSGSTPARGWRRPVPMIDVVRSAVAEVEDYTRVTVASTIGDVSLAGRSVGDIVHLLAELIENALSFSPPYTQVEVSGRKVAKGYVIEIEDHGLGMTDELLASLNERISDPPEFNLSSSVHLGLYVVGRLAERYDVGVSLKHSSYGGTTAVVLIPRELISETSPEDAAPRKSTRTLAESRPVAIAAAPTTTATAVAAVVSSSRSPDEFPDADDESSATSGDEPRERTPEGFPRRRRKSPIRRPADRSPGRAVAPVTALTPPPRNSPETVAGEENEEATHAAEASTTPSGLPIRVPQASIAAPLRTGKRPAVAPEEDRDRTVGGGRSPDNVRRSISGLQAGTRRGRAEAARSPGETGLETDPTVDEEA
ncbi:nitrate- and nitrite sensing domain-containing protein [Actinoallomurus spadix]|uniref:histidine kinase n=1 Tax=Actinoallomurus spadix TaxID=79912 RepID=A0ABP3GPK1_9ACTN|nr:nitrate- and nitrite sensing domain-containing protein [Actinoallomurus spadix]MCO5989035.1 nitrate- and nitrite sensing domain-containing protein [Actinoallomurus spadix]